MDFHLSDDKDGSDIKDALSLRLKSGRTLPITNCVMNRVLPQFLAVLLMLASIRLAPAQPAMSCAVCGEALKGPYHLLDSPALPEKKAICDVCIHLDSVCFVCSLPVKLNYRTLDDGRLLCEQDAKLAVFSQTEMQTIWEEVRRDLAGMFSGFGMAPKNFTLSLVDRNELAKAHKNQFSWHDKAMTMGLTCTRIKNGTEFEHTVYLLNGLNPARLAAVCGHEYAHAWLQENVSRQRQLDGDTVEGFCELVAYKLMEQRNEAVEKKVILANAYTHGQINALLQAEESFQFYRILQWLKMGVDERIDKSNLPGLLKLQKEPAPSLVWAPQPARAAAPETLMLKGISGTAQRRFALINDCTLEKNEEAKVRIGKTNLMVRCLDISERSVVIQPRGSAEKIRLSLQSSGKE